MFDRMHRLIRWPSFLDAKTYNEARQFASNISRMSARDVSMVSNPARMKMLMGNLREAMNDAIGDAAERGMDGGRPYRTP